MLLNKVLADLNIYNSNLRTLHYNVEGPAFVSYHRLFEEFYTETTEHIDDLAEMIATMGETPVSNFKGYLEHGTVAELSEKPYPGLDAIEKCLKNTEHMASQAKSVIKEHADNDVVVDFFTDLLAIYEKRNWMLRQTMK